MNKNNTDSQQRAPLWQRLLGILGSMNLAILLLLTLCLITLAGALTEQNQSQAYYDHVYGPFWTAFFQVIELFRIYSSPWFLLLVSLLIVSIGTCLWRNSPRILASFGRNPKEYHPGEFSKQRQWDVNSFSAEKLADLKRQFSKRGFKINSRTVGEELHLHANRGGLQKLGYLIIHISILIIFLGGMLDANIFMDINLPNAKNALVPYSVKPTDVPTNKVLPTNNTAFSAISTLPLGQSENTVMIREKDGYYLQKLPFMIHLTGLKTDFYADGSPKGYQADLEIIDNNGKVHKGEISAQQSLSYQGFTIAHRGNAGSNAKLTLSMYKFNDNKPLLSNTQINLPYRMDIPNSDSIAIDDYKLQNADPSRKIDISEEFQDIGPSIQYHIQHPDGSVVNVEYYLNPYQKDGSQYYLLRVTEDGQSPTIIFLPIDKDASLKKFLSFNNILYKKDLIQLLFSSKLKNLFKQLNLNSDYLQKQALNQVLSLLSDYAQHGREYAITDQIKDIKETDQDAASLYMDKILDSALLMVYKQVLINEQGQPATSVSAKKINVDMNYFNELKTAIDQFKQLGIDYIPVITQHSQDQGVVLAVIRHPGKYIVLGGMFALVLGILMIFYINYREYLVRISIREGNASIHVDAYTNRSDTQFSREFVNLTDVLMSVTL